MLHFLLDGVPDERIADISHAAFELGCRLNTRFALHRARDAIPSDAIVVSYGGNSETVTIPISLKSGELLEQDGKWLFAAPGEIPDVFAGTADLIAFRHETKANTNRDKMGRILPGSNPLGDRLREPLLENNAAFIRRLIEKAGLTLPHDSSPFGRGRYAVCLTHDVDGPQLHSPFALMRSLIYALRGDKYERESFELGMLTKVLRRDDPYWNFQLWQAFERCFGARSTFLIYPGKLPAAPRHPRDPHYNPDSAAFENVMRSLVDEGWEVGPHIGIRGHSVTGYKQAIDNLRRLSTGPCTSVRTHYWSGVSPSPINAWKQMEEAGFEIDASLSPQSTGYRGGAMLPIMPSFRWRADSNGIVAMATPLMDAYLIPRTAGISREEAESQSDQILRNARSGDGLVVLDWHCRTLCNIGAWKGFISPLVETLQSILSDGSATFLTMNEVGKAWREHAKLCFSGSTFDMAAR